jgi:hypothetical protein
MTTDPDEADLFFSAYQKNAKQSKETFHAIQADSRRTENAGQLHGPCEYYLGDLEDSS